MLRPHTARLPRAARLPAVLAVALVLLACSGPAPDTFLAPLDFVVYEPFDTFEVCAHAGVVTLFEFGATTKIWSTQTACMDQNVGIPDPIALEPERRYQLRSTVEPDDLDVWGATLVPVAVK